MTWALRATYRFTAADAAEAERLAAHLARDQTVETAAGAGVPEDESRVLARAESRVLARVESRVLARVESVLPVHGVATRFATVLTFPPDATGEGDLLQLVNVLYGNAAFWPGVRLEAVEWSEGIVAPFAGPRFGIDGVRALCGVTERRPLLAAALKPLGASPRELARRAADAVLGGVDLVKDDHGLADQTPAPFRERIFAVAAAIERAARARGRAALYAPNLTGPVDRLADRLDDLAQAGVRAALVAPLLLGLDAVRALAASSGLALVAHPALAGALAGPPAGPRGIAPGVLFGDLFRLAGADAVLFPAARSRFAVDMKDVEAVAVRLTRPWGAIAPAFPMLAGGVDAARLAELSAEHGPDTLYLASSAPFAATEPRAAFAQLAARLAGLAEP